MCADSFDGSPRALLEAVGLGARRLDNVGAVGEPVQRGGGQGLIAKDLSPVGELQVGGQNDGYPLVERRAKLEEQIRAGRGKGDEAEFVQDDDLMAQSAFDEVLVLMLVLGADRLVHERGGTEETEAPSSGLSHTRRGLECLNSIAVAVPGPRLGLRRRPHRLQPRRRRIRRELRRPASGLRES